MIEDVAEVARWAKGIEGVHECIAGRFRRPEPRRRALDYLRGPLSPVERKNGWQLAEQAGDATPYGVQHLLSTCVWDADLVRDDLRDYVVEHLGDVHGVLVVDETGFLKKGNKSVGVQRQYSGTAGRIENCQIGVFLTYASAQGRTLLDRELYLPRVWADDLERRREAGVPEKAAFRTKPQLARRMLERALESGVPFGWVTGDEVYGNDRNLRLWLERRDVPHVLAVRSNEKPWAETDRGWRQVRADRLAPGVEEPGWVRCSAGDGAKGPRVYDWARVEIRPLKEPGKGYWLLVRRSIAKPGELAYYVCFGPVDTTLEELVRVAGTRWTLVGPSKNALRRPRERWVWTSMKSGNGMAGTGTSPWRCWPTPAWRWSGARRWNQEVREKRGLSQLGRKADTPDGARGPAVALPADMETSTYGRISAAVVPVETAAPGNGPALPLPTPPETPHHISATVVLRLGRTVLTSMSPECTRRRARLGASAAASSLGQDIIPGTTIDVRSRYRMVASSKGDHPLLLTSATSPKRTSRQPSGIRVLLDIIALLLPFLFIGVELVNRQAATLPFRCQPLLEGPLAFAGGPAAQQHFHADVLVQVGPVDTLTCAD